MISLIIMSLNITMHMQRIKINLNSSRHTILTNQLSHYKRSISLSSRTSHIMPQNQNISRSSIQSRLLTMRRQRRTRSTQSMNRIEQTTRTQTRRNHLILSTVTLKSTKLDIRRIRSMNLGITIRSVRRGVKYHRIT